VFGNYDDQDRLITYDQTSYGYTAKGSLKCKAENGDTTFYNYDLLGNLISVNLPDGTFIEYIIDGQNRRVGKVVNGQFKKGWIYQDQINPVAELDSLGQMSARFIYGSKGHVPDYMIKGGVTYSIITDHLGSVRLIVDAAGNVVQSISYDEFGNIIDDRSGSGDPPQAGFQPFGFAGGLSDSHTGLVRFGARDYDAKVGRWTSKDPIGFYARDANFYAYCFNNPIKFIDPSGLKLWYADSCSESYFKPIIKDLMKSSKGRELLKLLHGREEIYFIHLGPYTSSKRTGKVGNDVYIDPSLDQYMKLQGSFDIVKVDIIRQLAHELGHLANPEYSEEQNILYWENPVMFLIDNLIRDPRSYGKVVHPIIIKG